MDNRRYWAAFSLLVVLAVTVIAVAIVSLGHVWYTVLIPSALMLLVYFYMLYKLMHVEVVPEEDLMLFDDPEDLRILCGIYGLGRDGSENELRDRLLAFSRENASEAFAWVSPKTVRAVGSAFEIQPTTAEPRRSPEPARLVKHLVTERSPKALTSGKFRSAAGLGRIVSCPICGANRGQGERACPSCGADLEFYAELSRSRVGRLLVAKKGVARRRKLRYGVEPFAK
jgi:hypothetical protein